MSNAPDLENSEFHTNKVSSSMPTESFDVGNLTNNADLFSGKHMEGLINYENTKEYWKDHLQENITLLQKESEDLLSVYKNIVIKDKQLRGIKITNNDNVSNASFCFGSLEDGQLKPIIAFNFSNQEKYTDLNLEFSLRQIAIQLGSKYEDIKDNEKLVKTFIFLHEFGHARDFIDNYLKTSEKKDNKTIVEVLRSAGIEYRKRRIRDLMTLPLPQHIKFNNDEDRRKYRKRLETYGIKPDENGHISLEKVDIVQSNAYRGMSSESIADSFAVNYIMNNRDDFFLRLGEPDDHSGRIKTGSEIMMEDKDIILSGIRDGKSITLKKVSQDGHSEAKTGYSITGFLDGQLSLGESIKLVKDIDDLEHMQTSPIKSINRRMLPDGSTLFIAKTSSGATYEVIMNSAVKPKPIKKKVEEMNQALGIKRGSEVIIMKRNILNEKDSVVLIGQTMQGRLVDFPKLGDSISLVDNKGDLVVNTSPIVEVRRNWRSWLIMTGSNSVYEILTTE